MAKKKTSPEPDASAAATPAAASTRRRTPPRTSKNQAAAPVDIPAIGRTDPLESAADTGGGRVVPDSYEPSHHEVAEAAYLRYLRRGGQGGDEFNDWVEAERELRSRSGGRS